ncbi:MAG: metallophosphoesterase family protein [Steroidobacteraceae bacterium]
MRVFAVSDLHVDYEENAKWVSGLSSYEYRSDALIVAGDVTDSLPLLARTLRRLADRFRAVLYVPGNHELWIVRDRGIRSSLEKFRLVLDVAEQSGACLGPYRAPGIAVVPLHGWYDYSFGEPTRSLREMWMDYHACRWPEGMSMLDVAARFAAMNPAAISAADFVVTFSHFLPRLDLLPARVAAYNQVLRPVLGTTGLELQLRTLGSNVHVYGHSHFNHRVSLEGVEYVNNALGYPPEAAITARRLRCVYGD